MNSARPTEVRNKHDPTAGRLQGLERRESRVHSIGVGDLSIEPKWNIVVRTDQDPSTPQLLGPQVRKRPDSGHAA